MYKKLYSSGLWTNIWTTSHIQNHVHQCWYLNLPNFLYSLIWKLYISELLSQEYLKPDSILHNVVKVILGNTQPVIWILVVQCAQHRIVSSSENSQASLEYRGAIFITLTYCITLYIIVEWLHTKMWTLNPWQMFCLPSTTLEWRSINKWMQEKSHYYKDWVTIDQMHWIWKTWNGFNWFALDKPMANTVCMMCSFSPSFDWPKEFQSRYSLPM